MNGLELAKEYYTVYGKPMLETDFKDILPYLAIGFVGKGSEHFGFDDLVSRDHDFEPGFCIFLPGEEVVNRRQEFLLERGYAKLPKELHGVKREWMAPVGGKRNGVLRIQDFYQSLVGSSNGDFSLNQWLHLPDYALAEAVNGEVYEDYYGEFSSIREKIKKMPEDVVLKRIAGNILIMAQSGQYNFQRCIAHGELEAAQFAITEFVQSSMKVIFLLRGAYMPYYKWSFHALRQLDVEDVYTSNLSFLLCADSCSEQHVHEKIEKIEQVCTNIEMELLKRNWIEHVEKNIEASAYDVNAHIRDNEIRNMHIMEAI